jgi:transketolase C-terminal domain/subunit
VAPHVFSIPFLAPASTHTFERLWNCGNVITLEEHVIAGGLGSMLREIAPDNVRIRSLAVSNTAADVVGSQEYLRAVHGLTPERIIEAARDLTGLLW